MPTALTETRASVGLIFLGKYGMIFPLEVLAKIPGAVTDLTSDEP